MEKVLETAIYCKNCNYIIKDKELAVWECGQCEPNLSNWENVEIVMRSESKSSILKAMNDLEQACEKICRVDAGMDEY